MASSPVIDAILRGSRRRGLDPHAVLAVAAVEGLSGRIGDQGTSFGPFQLHIGGAFPQHVRGNRQQWAMSPAGIDYALDRIAGVARGKRGRAAIEAIVRRFERPAAPGAEIQRAFAQYGRVGGGGSALSLPPRAPGSTSPAPASAPDLTGLFNLTRDLVGLPERSSALDALTMPQQAKRAYTRGPGVQKVDYGGAKIRDSRRASFPLGGSAKLIGVPYKGTHRLGDWESDNAVDLASPVGTPIRAVADGVIGPQFGSLGKGGQFAGLRLHLLSKSNEFYYAHLSRFAPGLKPGSRVRKGDIIGYSGEANGVAHLHFGQRHGNPRRLIRV